MCKLNKCAIGEFFNGTACKICPQGYYCPSVATPINETSPGVWEPAKSECGNGQYQPNTGRTSCLSCPANASHKLTGSTGIGDCTALAGYYGSGSTIQECSAGYYCPIGATSETACPGRATSSTSSAGSDSISDCTALAGYYRSGNGNSISFHQCGEGNYCPIGATSETACPSYTTSPVASTTVTACVPNPGYYGAAGVQATACPGVGNANDPSANNISTKGLKTDRVHCEYGACGSNKFRNSAGECKPFNSTSSCPAGKIFIEGNQIGKGKIYSDYNADIVSNYDNTTHIYGHDNMCLPSSQICT
tara:strand:- start:2106 stop:3023 length:918 start_codon:yes stop_codon:yes gene_type:complete